MVVLLLQPRDKSSRRQFCEFNTGVTSMECPPSSPGLAPPHIAEQCTPTASVTCDLTTPLIIRPLTHAPEIGAIGLNSTPDYYGTSSSCRCTTSNVVDRLRDPNFPKKSGRLWDIWPGSLMWRQLFRAWWVKIVIGQVGDACSVLVDNVIRTNGTIRGAGTVE